MKEIALVLAVSLGVCANLGVLGLFFLARQARAAERFPFTPVPGDERTLEFKWPTPPE